MPQLEAKLRQQKETNQETVEELQPLLQESEKKLRSVENVLKYLNILYQPASHEIMDLQKRLSSQNTELESKRTLVHTAKRNPKSR